MELGINIQTGDSFEKFVGIINDVGITRVKANLDLDSGEVAKAATILKKKKVRSYITFFKASPDIFENWDDKMKMVEESLDHFSKRQVLGIGLVEDVHTVLRRGTSRRGIHKEFIVECLNKLSKVIRDKGFKVVFQMRVDDIQGNLWSGVDFDIYDAEIFLSPNAVEVIKKLKTDKPLWFGKAGKYGGYINPTVQKNSVREIRKLSDGLADIAFLWSSGDKKFSWSEEGVFRIAASEIVQ